MRLLVDSHVLLWHLRDDPRLKPAPTAAIEAEDADVFVSTASLWELAIKSALGKLTVPGNLPAKVEEMGFEWLPVSAAHAWAVRELPPNHGDPFDRILIAQARIERLPVVTADSRFAEYGVEVVWD